MQTEARDSPTRPRVCRPCDFGQREFPVGFPEIEIYPQVLTRQWFRGTGLLAGRFDRRLDQQGPIAVDDGARCRDRQPVTPLAGEKRMLAKKVSGRSMVREL